MKNITIDELAEKLELQIWLFGCNEFKITTNFSSNGKQTYVTKDLHIEIEKDIVLFYDSDEILIGSGLMAILKETIDNVCYSFTNGTFYEYIYFKDGNVCISSKAAA